MPRLSHSLIRKGYNKSSLLPLVLRGTRTLDSAINELRWLTEHVSSTNKHGQSPRATHKRLLQLCLRRSRAEPLQYILGSQPFGDLDIKCRPGVLIPRPETEAYTAHVAKLLLDSKLEVLTGSTGTLTTETDQLTKAPSLNILDVCSGSGCISLLLHSLLSKKFNNLYILGLDISETAITLAKANLQTNMEAGKLLPRANWQKQTTWESVHHPQVQFHACDVLGPYPPKFGHFDIMISNPPYISTSKFVTETTRSARNFEPRLALVPYNTWKISDSGFAIEPEDIFYERLLKLHYAQEGKLLVMEIGDEEQARRVVQMALSIPRISSGNRIEIWRDWPDMEPEEGEETSLRVEEMFIPMVGPDMFGMDAIQKAQAGRRWEEFDVKERGVWIEGRDVPVKGAGNIRSVVLFRR